MIMKKETEEDTNDDEVVDMGGVFLLEGVKTVLREMLGSTDVDCHEIAQTVLTAWRVKGAVPRLDLDGKIPITASRRKEIEDKVLQKIQLHVLLSYFEESHCADLFSDDRIGISYSGIVRKVNSCHLEPVLDYPSVRPGMDDSMVEEVKKQRYQVEEAIKLWFRQLRHPDMARLPEFTSDKAWLEMLYAWSTKQDQWRQGCLITPSTAPDCHYKFEHMKQFQTEWSTKHLTRYLKYCHLLEQWPTRFFEFSGALKRIGSKKEGNPLIRPGRSLGYGYNNWSSSNSYYI